MKTITTLISIIVFQFMAIGQAQDSQQPVNASACSVSYSENSGEIIHNASAPVKCREITIESIPSTQSVTVVNIEFGMTGSFTFKKDASLELNQDKDVYIEDMLTGKVFDLKTSDSYTFNVNRRVPNRFILHIDKMLMRYAVSLR